MEHASGATDRLRRLSGHRGGQRPSASIRRLLAHGADPNLRDPRHHCTPLEEAQMGDSPGYREVEAILRPLNGDPSVGR
jgi:hypothetical protein